MISNPRTPGRTASRSEIFSIPNGRRSSSFLLTEYGYERLETLFRSPKSEEVEADEGRMFYVTPADYQSVYGLELNQLEAQWLEHLMDEAEVTRTPRRRVCPMCIEGESLPASVPAVPSAP